MVGENNIETKEFKVTETMTAQAKKALDGTYLCTRCLGRLCAGKISGISSAEKGDAIYKAIGELPKGGVCWLCENKSRESQMYADMALKEIGKDSFESFRVYVNLHEDMSTREKEIAIIAGAEGQESLASDMEREITGIISRSTTKEPNLEAPGLLVIVDPFTDTVEIDRSPPSVEEPMKPEWEDETLGGQAQEVTPQPNASQVPEEQYQELQTPQDYDYQQNQESISQDATYQDGQEQSYAQDTGTDQTYGQQDYVAEQGYDQAQQYAVEPSIISCPNCKSQMTPEPKLVGGYKCPYCGFNLD